MSPLMKSDVSWDFLKNIQKVQGQGWILHIPLVPLSGGKLMFYIIWDADVGRADKVCSPRVSDLDVLDKLWRSKTPSGCDSSGGSRVSMHLDTSSGSGAVKL